MKAIDAVRAALRMNDISMRFIEDMRDAPLTQPMSAGGNHPLWVLGHLAHSEAAFRQGMVGEPNPLEHWTPLFGGGSVPKADASLYPTFDEVHRAYREQRAASLKLLDEIGDAGLGQRPTNPPPGLEDVFDTVGATFLLMTQHHWFHCGQVADARRAAGRKPLIF